MSQVPGIISVARAVNVDASDVNIGQAVQAFIIAQATGARRADHLEKRIVSIMFNRKGGVIVHMDDAGSREHLANALKFKPGVKSLGKAREGTSYARTGEIFGVDVTIWNLEP